MMVNSTVQAVDSSSFQEQDRSLRVDDERKAREEMERAEAARESGRREELDSETRGKNVDETA